MRIKLSDVAMKAGVSVACVSDILNGKRSRFSEQTIQRVCAASNSLSYIPNTQAKALARKRSMVMAMILPNVLNPFFPELMESVIATARQNGYSIMMINAGETSEGLISSVQLAYAQAVDAILLVPGEEAELKLLPQQIKQIPLIILDRFDSDTSQNIVITSDNYAGMRMALQYLWEKGHRRFVYVSPKLRYGNAHERCRSYCDFLHEKQQVNVEKQILFGDYSVSSGELITRKILEETSIPDALIFGNDLMAIGALTSAKRAGLSVPRDIAVIGFDNIAFSAYTDPPLTTIDQPKAEIGRLAVKMALEEINGQADQEKQAMIQKLVPTLIKRESA